MYFIHGIISAQTNSLNLETCIEIALKNSKDAQIIALQVEKTNFVYNAARLQQLPKLTAEFLPVYFDRSFVKRYDFETNTEAFRAQQNLFSSAGLVLEQPILATGGSLKIYSNLNRFENLAEKNSAVYTGIPVSVSFTQPLSFFNKQKHELHLATLQFDYEKIFLKTKLIGIKQKAANYYFTAAQAQLQYEIDKRNLASFDSVYKRAAALHQNAAVSKQQLIQLELALLQAQATLKTDSVELILSLRELSNYLNTNELLTPEIIKSTEIFNETNIKNVANNSDILLAMVQNESRKAYLKQARSEKFSNASVYIDAGFNQTSALAADVYTNPKAKQMVQLGFRIPLFDFGRNRALYKAADADYKSVSLIANSGRATELAKQSTELTKTMFLAGNAKLIELQDALNQETAAEIRSLNYVREYWILRTELEKLLN